MYGSVNVVAAADEDSKWNGRSNDLIYREAYDIDKIKPSRSESILIRRPRAIPGRRWS